MRDYLFLVLLIGGVLLIACPRDQHRERAEEHCTAYKGTPKHKACINLYRLNEREEK